MAGMQAFTKEQIQAVAAAFGGRWAIRNRTLFVVQCMTGFRQSEILSLTRGDVLDPDGNILKALHVKAKNMKGKNARSRSVPLNALALKYLNIWLPTMKALGYGHKLDPLWPTTTGHPLKQWSHWDIYRKTFRKAGLAARGYGTHSPRKTFALENYIWLEEQNRQGKLSTPPIRVLQQLMGHSDIRATMRYLPDPASKTTEALDALGSSWDI